MMDIQKYIRHIPDFPIKGVGFKDIAPLLANPQALTYVIEQMKLSVNDAQGIVAIDARGFIFGSILAKDLQIPLILARKKGKLPGDTQCISYGLEYGENTLCIQKECSIIGKKISIIDDVLATGGTALAAANLVEKAGGIVNNLVFVLELDFLGGKEKLQAYKTASIIQFKNP